MASQEKIAAASIKKWNKQYMQSAFIYFAKTNPETNLEDYPQYFHQELGITDNRSYAKRLARQGLMTLTKQGTVELTKEGKSAWDKDDVAFLQLACPHVTIGEYRAHRENTEGGDTFEQVMISLLCKKIEELFSKKELKKVGDLCLEVALLSERIADYECAARHYIKALYYDLRGTKYKNIMSAVESGYCTRLDAIKRFDSIYIRPQVIKGLQRVKDCRIDDYVADALNRKKLKFCYCAPDRFPQLVAEILDGTYDELNWREHYLECYKHRVKVCYNQCRKKEKEA